MMSMIQDLVEKLRPLVGSGGWDYCTVWKLSEDQRLLEWMNCCCAGAEYGEGVVSGGVPLCRDMAFPHMVTRACELLSLQPPSLSLECGNPAYAQTLISCEPGWMNFGMGLDAETLEEQMGTKVLIPVPGGLIELAVAKHVPEDRQVIGFITAQFNLSMEAGSSLAFLASDIHTGFSTDDASTLHELYSRQISGDTKEQNVSSTEDLPEDLSIPANLLQPQYGYALENLNGNSKMESTAQATGEYNFPEMDTPNTVTEIEQVQVHPPRHGKRRSRSRSRSISDCSDQNDEEEDKNEKPPQCKNLHAERKRRKKLKDKLYTLRSLVPKISKLDRASILGDAIEFIRDMQKQAKDLQDELDNHSEVEDDGNPNTGHIEETYNHNNLITIGAFGHCGESSHRNHDPENNCDKQQQMEPQVEVTQMDGNEFFVKVFGERRRGGFVRLMEALDAIGLEVTNANVTSFLSLVSNIFIVEKKDTEMVHADYVKDSLLEVSRNPSAAVWPGLTRAAENQGSPSRDSIHQHNYHHLLHNHLF